MAKRRGRGEGGLEQLKSGSWRAVISLGIDKGTGKRVKESRAFGTKAKAVEWRNKRMVELGAGPAGDPERCTVAEWMERWLATVKKARAAATWKQYSVVAARRVVPGVGHLRLVAIRRRDVRAWITAMEEEGVPQGERAKAVKHLGTCLAAAMDAEMIAVNPAMGWRLPAGKAKREIRALSAAELTRLVASARAKGREAWFRLAADSGMRPSELLALRWTDFDWHKGEVRVTRALCSETGLEKEVKTKRSRRTIPLGPQTVAVLRAEMEAQRARPWHAPDSFAFASARRGVPRCYQGFRVKFFQPVADAASLPALCPYDMRHTCATLLLSAGVSLRVVADRLGNSPVITLRHYAHALPGEQRAATDTMAAIMAG